MSSQQNLDSHVSLFKQLQQSSKNRNMISVPELLSVLAPQKSQAFLQADQIFPVRVTRSWFSRMVSLEDPIAKQVIPQPLEMMDTPNALMNPVGEQDKMPVPFVVQKHKDRLLLLLSRKCHIHCRYCFRRTLDGGQEPSQTELQQAIDYILASGVQEVILSGGDPLFVSNAKLFDVLAQLKSIPTIRIHTRAPISFPERVDNGLLEGLSQYRNLWLIVHCNHPQELSDEVLEALYRIRQVGVPLLNQAVLLKGVNDSADVLAALFEKLVQNGVFPYYLHHTDKVQGAADFFMEIEEGLKIYRELQTKISGVALPRYVIDVPDGSGKVDVAQYWQLHQSE